MVGFGIFDDIVKIAGNILGSKDKDGQSQFLELFKGQSQKKRDFEVELNKAFEKRLEMKLKDTENARSMQIAALKQDSWLAKHFIYLLTGMILITAAILSLVPVFYEIPENSMSMVTRATDFFYTIAGGSVIGFFFGTDTKKQ